MVGWRFDQFRQLGFGEEDSLAPRRLGRRPSADPLARRRRLPTASRAPNRPVAHSRENGLVPILPALARVEFRMFRGPSDYPHLVRIINVWARAEGDDRVETVEGSRPATTISTAATRRSARRRDRRYAGRIQPRLVDQEPDGPRLQVRVLPRSRAPSRGSAAPCSTGTRRGCVRSQPSTTTLRRRSFRRCAVIETSPRPRSCVPPATRRSPTRPR